MNVIIKRARRGFRFTAGLMCTGMGFTAPIPSSFYSEGGHQICAPRRQAGSCSSTAEEPPRLPRAPSPSRLLLTPVQLGLGDVAAPCRYHCSVGAGEPRGTRVRGCPLPSRQAGRWWPAGATCPRPGRTSVALPAREPGGAPLLACGAGELGRGCVFLS